VHAEINALLGGQHGELGAQRVVQVRQCEGVAIRGDTAVFQTRNVQQVGDQVLGRAQRAVQMMYQFLRLARQGVVLMGQGGGEQACGVQRLHQVVADRGEETRLRLVGRLGGALGVGQRLVEQRQFLGPFADALFQALVGVLQRSFGLAEGGDVAEAHDEAATRHRVADQFHHPAIGEGALGGMRTALAHPVETLGDVSVGIARAAQPAFGVVANDVGDGAADVHQPVGVIEHFQVAVVPGHQAQRLVDHADALGDVLDGALQQGPVELQHLGGFADDAHHVLDLHVAAFERSLDHRTCGRGAQHPGQQALGMGDPLAIGGLSRGELLAVMAGEALEAELGTLGADEARRQHQQIFDLHGQQAPATGGRGDFLTDEAAGLPVLGHARLRQYRDPEEQRGVAQQREHHAECQCAGIEGQVGGVHPLQAREHFQRPAEQRQDQRIEPDQRAGGEAGEYAAAVRLFPVQRADHRRGQLGEGGEGDLADGRQARGAAQQPVTDVCQQQDHDDGDAADREHPVAEGLEGLLGFLAA